MSDYLKATEKIPRSFRFDGKPLRSGERFESKSPVVTRTMLTLGYAERVTGDSIPAAVGNDEITPTGGEAPTGIVRRRPGRPRKYARRDMQAED